MAEKTIPAPGQGSQGHYPGDPMGQVQGSQAVVNVLATASWLHGSANHGMVSGLASQVTKCSYLGQIFYVRENCNGIPAFIVSSGERWGDKCGTRPRPARQILELCCHPQLFKQLAILVRNSDALGRRVQANRDFTVAWAETLFQTQKPS